MTQVDQGAPGDALTLGYIPGSAEFLKADSPPLEFGLRSLRALIQARASIGIQRYVPSAHPTIERIDIVVNFALDEPPYAAPFYAWQHLAVPGEYVKTSAPLCFTTGIPHAAGIDVNFRLRSPISATVVGGVLSYPIGGAGLGYGIYALAAPSPATGGAPDWNQITWSGQAGVLARNDGGAIDFDYVTLLLIPAADS
jgi:hypothetical protein